MSSLVEKHAPIDAEIANALIGATPDTWDKAEMSVTRVQDGEIEKMKILISSPEGHQDVITPSDEIYAGLYKLSDVFREHGTLWTEVFYSIGLTAEGKWKYQVKFTY